MDIKKSLKFSLLFSFLTVFTAAVQAHSVEKDKMVSPSADFIELIEAYQNRIPIPAEKNGFVYLMGIMAPKDEDPIAYGQAAINWSNNKVANGGKSDSPEPTMTYPLGKSYKALMKEIKINCRIREAAPCALAKHQTLAREAIEQNQWLLKRWHELLDFSNYQNTLSIDLTAILPYYANDIQLQRLKFFDLWLNRNNYLPEKIKHALQKDYDFHMLQAANAITLIEKAIATAALHQHYYWLNEILRSVDHHTSALIVPDYLQQPILRSALSLRKTYAGELQFFISTFKPYNESEYNPIFPLFSDNDKQRIFNQQAQFLKKLINISESADYQTLTEHLMEDHDVIQLLKVTEKLVEKYGGNWDEFNDNMGGYIGKYEDVLIWLNATFINRTRQLVAIQKAVTILNAIRQQDIGKDAISEWLKDPKHYNPIIQKPYIWDGDKKHLIIKTENDIDTYYLSL